MKTYLIFGASKGLGDAFVKGLPRAGNKVWIVSRSRPQTLEMNDGVERKWLEVDLSKQDQASMIQERLQGEKLDVLIYNVGIWEQGGFEEDYSFDNDQLEDITAIISTNILSPIAYMQALLPNLRRSDNGKIILIGSSAGLDHTNNVQVSFVASKFGLRGIAHALREHVRKDNIAVTCINPGELAAEIPYEEGVDKALSEYQGTRIPVQDIVSVVQCVIHLSKAACVKEIHIPAMTDLNA